MKQEEIKELGKIINIYSESTKEAYGEEQGCDMLIDVWLFYSWLQNNGGQL